MFPLPLTFPTQGLFLEVAYYKSGWTYHGVLVLSVFCLHQLLVTIGLGHFYISKFCDNEICGQWVWACAWVVGYL